jgi:hypothetical protein
VAPPLLVLFRDPGSEPGMTIAAGVTLSIEGFVDCSYGFFEI